MAHAHGDGALSPRRLQVLLNVLLDHRIIFVGGKGGVGKTTIAAAIALAVADRGRRCLLVSTDPAHSLGDIFGAPIGDAETPLGSHLWGLEIDPDAEAARHIALVKNNMKRLVHPRLYAEVDRQLDLASHAPGATEAALLERVAELMGDAGHRFDLVIFDTAPTGHTLRLLSLPDVMRAWTDGLLKHRDRSRKLGAVLKSLGGRRDKGDDLSLIDGAEGSPNKSRTAQITQILTVRRGKFIRARELLVDATASAFLLVLNPDKLSILESTKALHLLGRFNVPVAAIIVNRNLPEDAGGDFLRARRLQEQTYREEIDREFGRWPRVCLPLLPHDVYGTDTLRQIAKLLVS